MLKQLGLLGIAVETLELNYYYRYENDLKKRAAKSDFLFELIHREKTQLHKWALGNG